MFNLIMRLYIEAENIQRAHVLTLSRSRTWSKIIREAVKEIERLRNENAELAAWKGAVATIRARYPLDVFPEDSTTPDGRGARFARLLCDNIKNEAEGGE